MYQWIILVIISLVLFVLVYQKWHSVKESDKKTMFSFDAFIDKKDTDLSYRPLTVTYKIYEINDLLPQLTCYQLCNDAKPLLSPSSNHTFTGCIIKNEITEQIQKIASSLSGFPISHMENVVVTCYKEGDTLEAHYDMTTVGPISKRVCTLILFLNEGYNGGEIEFVTMDQVYHGTTGKGLFFWIASDDKPIFESKYKSRPVFRKTKWMATLWVHSSPL